MVAKGKTNASQVRIGNRIIVKVSERGDSEWVDLTLDQVSADWMVTPSKVKTGEKVYVTTVTGKDKCINRRGYMITTGRGTFYAEPIQTMWLAPEDPAGIKRAYAEALAENEARGPVADTAPQTPASPPETETTGEKVKPGDRILVKALHNASGLRTRTAPATGWEPNGTEVSQVVEKEVARDDKHFWILTGRGGFFALPTDVIKLAPEDDAAVSAAYFRASSEHHDKMIQSETASLRAEFPDAPPARRMAIRRRLVDMGQTVYPDRAEPDEDFQVDRLRARFPLAGEREQETIIAKLAQLGTVVFPEGTPEYAKFRDELRRKLMDPGSWKFVDTEDK